jgi:hypothetical protein
MAWLDWEQSTHRLLEVVMDGSWDGRWMPGEHFWFAAYDPRAEIMGGRGEQDGVVLVGDESGRLQTAPLEVPNGRYRLQVYGRWFDTHGTGHVDVLANGGSLAVAGFDISADFVGEGTLVFESFVEIEGDHTALAFRIAVSGGSRFWIEGCGLRPDLTGAQADDASESGRRSVVH